jgi:chorismate mutase
MRYASRGRSLRRLTALPLFLFCGSALIGCWSTEPAAPPAVTATKSDRPVPGDDALDGLLELMRQRLLLMHDVARWKWNQGAAITDPDRERQLLTALEERGLHYGLSRQQTRAFMSAQIEAGKLVQEADFADWNAKNREKFEDVRDLGTDLRPRIDELSDQLLKQLAELPHVDEGPARAYAEQRAEALLVGDGIDDAVRSAAIRPLFHGESP